MARYESRRGAARGAPGWISRGGSVSRLAVVGVAVLLVASGCGDGGGVEQGTPAASSPGSGTPSVTPSATPSATASLNPEEQQAFEEATETVLAYRQTVIDLLSGSRTNLNDLNAVVTGELLQDDLKNMQTNLSEGRRADPGAEAVLVGAQPVDVDLDGDPPTVRLRACVDLTAITFTSADGSREPGTRGQADYVLVKTDYLPPPGWAVAKVQGPADEEARRC